MVLLVGTLSSVTFSSPTPAQAFEYVVQQGDTFRHLARRFYGDPLQWPRIVKANGLDGKSIRPGQTLLIPEEGDPNNPTARILSTWGEVQFQDREDALWAERAPGSPMAWLNSVKTGARSGVSLNLRDMARVNLGENTECTILGVVQEPAKDKPLKVRVALGKGTLELDAPRKYGVVLEILHGEKLWEISGDVLFSRGGGDTRVAVFEGSAILEGTEIKSGLGAVVHRNQENPKLSPLPPTVLIRNAAYKSPPIRLSTRGAADWGLSWASTEDASEYEMELRSVRSGELLEHRIIQGTSARVTLPGSDLFTVRVRAKSIDRLPGSWGQSRVMSLLADEGDSSCVHKNSKLRCTGGAVLSFPSLPEGFTLFSSIDGKAPHALQKGEEVEVSGIGKHVLQLGAVVDSGGQNVRMSSEFEVSVEPVPGIQITLDPPELDPLAPPVDAKIKINLKDLEGNPVLGDEPLVKSGGRWCLAKATETPGEYICSFRPRAAPGLESLAVKIKGKQGSFETEAIFKVKTIDKKSIKVFRK